MECKHVLEEQLLKAPGQWTEREIAHARRRVLFPELAGCGRTRETQCSGFPGEERGARVNGQGGAAGLSGTVPGSRQSSHQIRWGEATEQEGGSDVGFPRRHLPKQTLRPDSQLKANDKPGGKPAGGSLVKPSLVQLGNDADWEALK